jgi:hypothetical protein
MLPFLAAPIIAEVILPIAATVLTAVAAHKCERKQRTKR